MLLWANDFECKHWEWEESFWRPFRRQFIMEGVHEEDWKIQERVNAGGKEI